MTKKRRSESLAESVEYAIPLSLTTRDGVHVDTRDMVWRMGPNDLINWENAQSFPLRIGAAIKSYICQQLTDSAAGTARATFWRLVGGLQRIPSEELEAIAAGEIAMNLFYAFKSALENDNNISHGTAKEMQSSYRRWYVWCVDVGFPGFSDEASIELLDRTIGGSGKGWAVLSSDPDEGPLGFVQDSCLEAAIARSFETIDLLCSEELQALTAVLLSKSYGLYGAHLQLINDSDYRVDVLSDGSEVHWIDVPRLKKRGVRARVGVRKRRLSSRLASCISTLRTVNERKRHAGGGGLWQVGVTPLFMRETARDGLVGPVLEDHAYRWSIADFQSAMRKFCESNGLRFRLNPRRLRYTFATRLVEEGCTPLELADALDHTDLQHVMVYFDARSQIVRQLDEAMAVRLAPIAMAFLGNIVAGPSEATRGDDPASVIKFKGSGSELLPVGGCGVFKSCGLDVPLACYTCPKMEPWADAPHEFVLSELLKDRSRRESMGLDEKLVQIHDRTIVAVAEVVRRISSGKSGGGQKRNPM